MADIFVKSFNSGGDRYYPLPIVTAEQDGMVLKVVDGEWTPSTLRPLIEFVIISDSTDVETTYQAEAGMTWEQWCDSKYNTDGFRTNGDLAVDKQGWEVADLSSGNLYNGMSIATVLVNGGRYEIQND